MFLGMDEFMDFLRGRGVPDLTIKQFLDENLDPAAIMVMPDDTLKTLLPKLGDRIAIKEYCKKELAPKKQSLIDRLKLKMSTPGNNTVHKGSCNKKVKTTRLIEVGWVCSMDGETYTQVRKLQGGGTRQIEIAKSATVQTVHQRALKLFFPFGKSTKGYLENFETRMVDFSLQQLDDQLTIEDYFSRTALTKLRFYLASKCIKKASPPAKRTRMRRAALSISRNGILSDNENSSDASNEKFRSLPNEADTEFISNRTTNEDPTPLLGLGTIDDYAVLSNQDYHPARISCEEEHSTNLSVHTDDWDNDPYFYQSSKVVMQTETFEQQVPKDDLSLLVNSILDCCESQPLPNATNTDICEPQTISSLLQHLQHNINTQKILQFNVYREDIFGCCVRAMRRVGFDPFSKISVKFSDAEGTSEGAVDEGGPCREMFRLSLNWLKDSGMFCGDHKKNLNLCGNALHKNMYFEAGRLIALSLIHGGPGPHFFSETLFTLLCGETAVPTLDDIDRDTREKITQFQNAKDLDELQTIIGGSDIFSLAGFPIIVKAEEQKKNCPRYKICISNTGTLRFFAVDRIREPLRQLIEGLTTCGLYETLKQYPSLFKDIFCSEITLSSKILEELFLIVYTEPGTNTRSTENRVISYFRDYVLDLECDPTNIVTLSDLLVFATGSDCPPPLGFPLRPQIMFLHEGNSRFPMANTCSLHLKLPVVHNSYEGFKTDMDFAMSNAKTFGFA